jgi:hypothetical protein
MYLITDLCNRQGKSPVSKSMLLIDSNSISGYNPDKGLREENGMPAQERKGITITAIIVNALIVLFTAYGMSRFFTVGGDGNMAVMNTRCFVYFTVDSNLLCAFCSVLLMAAQIRSLQAGRPVPAAFFALKLVGAAAVGVTFFTVFCFLGMLYGYMSMIVGVNFFMHLLTPLLAMLGFCLLESGPALRFRCVFLGLLPTILYGIVYVVQVVVKKQWMDFYGFNMGGHWILSCVLMLIATFLISLVLWALRRAAAGKKTQIKECV